MKMNDIFNDLDKIIKNPVCELNYKKDYELLIATVLSAQCTDKRVNEVTNNLFCKYKTLEELNQVSLEDIKNIIRSCGNYNKKSEYIKEITNRLINEKGGVVPNDFDYLVTLPGVGRKTSNVVLSELFNVPTIAVDTHVERVSKRLGLVREKDDVIKIEKKLMKTIPKEKWNRVNHQLVLFGRYHCKSINPYCNNCLLCEKCNHYIKNNKRNKTLQS